MKIDAALLKAMFRAGVTPEQIEMIADEYEALTAERRAEVRELGRIRQQNQRARNAASRVTESVTRDAPVPDKEKSPTPPKEINPIPEAAKAAFRSEPETAPSAVVFLPTVSDGDVPILEADVAEWQPAFPAVDVRQQLAAMRQWLLVNPTKRKTKRGIRKFVVSWLDRKQNSGSPPQPHAASPPSQPRQPRNVGELSLMQMEMANGQSSSTDIGRLDAGDGRRQTGGTGGIREIALGSDEYSRA